MKTSVWYAGKFNDGEDFISLNDVDLILVYLGKGVFRETKEKPTCAFQPLPVPKTKPARSADDEDYMLPPVYNPESPHRISHTRSMGAPQVWTVTKQSHRLRQPLQSQNHVVKGSQNRLL